ncbi:MAG: FkbM family methyltransferase [Candidatus Poseidoniales archaeon]|nr:MAG: FkbM family methyltransferase [Candidatus Poseidoniales archaeon]|tara:strand:+ start:3081 stop:3920 length:840 start_codon:yes stop_codon:yes gene_type:complete
MLRAFYWRLNLGLKKIKSKRLRKKLGNNIKAIITNSDNGLFAVDPEDLEVGLKLRSGGFGLQEIERLKKYINKESKVLIVGTHIGSLAIPLSKHCKEMTAIEANPNTFKLLEINLKLNNNENITPHNIFANDSHEKVEFLLNTVNSGGSKRKPKKSNFLYEYDNPEIIELESHRLDDFLPNHDYDLVLLDIEGSEYFAMKGMKEILSNCKTLVVEFLPHHLRNVADIDVDTFISVIPGQFTKFQLPDNNQEHTISEIKTVLQNMYDSNIGEDGIIFTSN